jgi:hypothetical protein
MDLTHLENRIVHPIDYKDGCYMVGEVRNCVETSFKEEGSDEKKNSHTVMLLVPQGRQQMDALIKMKVHPNQSNVYSAQAKETIMILEALSVTKSRAVIRTTVGPYIDKKGGASLSFSVQCVESILV